MPARETRFVGDMAKEGYYRGTDMPWEQGSAPGLARAGNTPMDEDSQALKETFQTAAVMDFLRKQHTSYFHHHRRMTRAEFEADKKLRQAFKLIATSFVGSEDSDDREEIVAIVEARR